jgi:serine phosphatase RsbU (regulator of sigma subunit)
MLLAPILVSPIERKNDGAESRGNVAQDGGESQSDGPSLDNTGQNFVQQSDSSNNGLRQDDSGQERLLIGALVLLSPFENAFDRPVVERIQILTRLVSEAMQQAQALSAHDVQDIDQKIARQIQSDLLCQGTPVLEDWDIAVMCKLSARARDVCSDFFRLPDRDKFVIIEPHSHGLSAAMTGMLAHTLIRANDAEGTLNEAKALEAMNAYLGTTQQPAALLCATIDRENILTLVNAGCASPLWWHNEHKHVEDLRSKGSALGLTADAVYEEKSIALEINDVLILCTNSLLEASAGKERFGQQRLIRALNQFVGAPASELATAIMGQVSAFCAQESDGQRSIQDDILLAVFRRQGDISAEPEPIEKQESSDGQEATNIPGDTHEQDA